MVKRWFVFLNIAVLLLASMPSVMAQSTPPCEPAEAREVLRMALDVLDSADADVSAVLRQVQRELGPLEAACAGLQWQGTGDWVSNVITFPDGFYRMTFSDPAARLSSVRIEDVAGDCGYASLMATSAEPEAQVMNELRECQGILTISASGPWFLTMEQLAP